MATAKKLPSGSWRVQVFSHFEEVKQPDGSIKKKRIYRSFTSDDPSPRGRKKVELEAARFAAQVTKNSLGSMTVSQAVERYIKSKKPVLSPSTELNYWSILKNDFDSIGRIQLDRLTNEIVQCWISELSEELSPKSVRNIHGLFIASVNMFRPEARFSTQLPAKENVEIYTPTDEDIRRLMEHVKGKDLEICICLAAFGPMRRGEICALTSEDIQGNTVTVNKSMVLGPDKKWHVKIPKSYAGFRTITYPEEVISMLHGREGQLFDFTPNVLSDRFKRAIRYSHLPHFRFHDLRHYGASILHAIGVPDAYIIARGGWASDYVMKKVYRHALDDRKEKVNDQINNYFENLMNGNGKS